ncbi:pyridoxamine 5'-phosphate oxidase family protein [Candidatus Uhrbacteria bacterium]|nr:pyridoxamine 5'-phosphate oxidase family protein [Candidatus Uhrbacteria bacterium]
MDTPWLRGRVGEALGAGYLMSLGTVDDGGVWVAEVIYVHDDALRIYWMSDPDTRHSRAIASHPQVAATITVHAIGAPNFGLQVSGRAERINGARHDLAVRHFLKRRHPAPVETDDVLQGDSWYVLIPEHIELIDEAHFGFAKQRLAMNGMECE